jgi:cysteine desulfurase/selenocysteine lyase
MDIQKIRSQFDILDQKVYNKPLIYFDNAATTQKPKIVLDIMNEYYTRWNANVHRGVHFLSNYCTDACEKSRKTIAQFIGAESEREIIFTSGTTDSVNIIAETFGRKYIRPGDEILVSQTEHHSNFVPWQQVALRHGAKFVVYDMKPTGEHDLDDFLAKLTDKTRIISVGHISNALGTVNPVKQIIEKAHAINVPVFVDGAQAVQHMPLNMKELDADFYAFSGHKMYGPTGIGILYGKEKWLEQLPPYRFGGEMIEKVYNTHTTFNVLPFKYEAGTPNYIGQIGLAAAVEFIQSVGIKNIASHEQQLLAYATQKLEQIEGIKIYGTTPEKAAVISFLAERIHPYDIGVMLDKMGIAVRTGNHCAQPLFDRLGIDGTIRASFAVYNTTEEIDFFISTLERIIGMFR